MTDLNKNSTLANNPVSSINPVDNPPKENPSKYDEVLNQYSQSKPETTPIIESTPEPEIKTESIPETPIETTPIVEPAPQPEIEVTPEPEFLNKTPDQIKQEISQILDDTPVDSISTIIPPVKPKTNIFQIIFVLSLIIFLIVVSAVAYFVFFNKTSSDNNDNSTVETVTPTPVSSATCTLNDKTYKVGEGFPSADGCNTCSCSEDGSIVCTLMACESTKSATTSSVSKDWKTFNSVIGISVNAPSNYFLVDASNEKGIMTFFSYDSNSNKYSAVGGLPINESKTDLYFTSEKSIDDYINKITSESTKILSQKDLTILGYKAKLIKSNSDVEGSSESMKYIINKNNSIFIASILLNRDTKQSVKDKFYADFTKMVESIKFK